MALPAQPGLRASRVVAAVLQALQVRPDLPGYRELVAGLPVPRGVPELPAREECRGKPVLQVLLVLRVRKV